MAKRKSVNTKLQDLAILRAAYLEKLKNGDVRKTMQFINDELLPEVVGKLSERLARADAAGVDRGPLTTERLSEVGSVLEGVLGNGIGKKTKDLIEKSLVKTGESEARWQVKTLTEMTKPLGLSYSMPSTAIIRQVVKERAPFGNTISEHLEGISTRAAGEIKKELRLGISQGESTDQIISRVRGTIDANYEDGVFEKVRKNVAAVVRTSTNYVVNQAREETIKANEDIIGSVKLVATLDDRTSLICAARDGEVYPINEGPRPPFHPNCRTMVVPITKSAEELGLEGILQDGDEDILARESMDGEVPADYTYEEWLAEQDEETQKRVLGLERWQMWTDGQITLRDLINDKSQVLTIDDLDELTGNREDAIDASQEESQAEEAERQRRENEAEEAARRETEADRQKEADRLESERIKKEAEDAARREAEAKRLADEEAGRRSRAVMDALIKAAEEQAKAEALEKSGQAEQSSISEQIRKAREERGMEDPFAEQERLRQREREIYEGRLGERFSKYESSPVDALTVKPTFSGTTGRGTGWRPTNVEMQAQAKASALSKPSDELVTDTELSSIQRRAEQIVEGLASQPIVNPQMGRPIEAQYAKSVLDNAAEANRMHQESLILAEEIGAKLGARSSTIKSVYIEATRAKLSIRQRAEMIQRMIEVLEEYPPDVTRTAPQVRVSDPDPDVEKANAWCNIGSTRITDVNQPLSASSGVAIKGSDTTVRASKGVVSINAKRLADLGINGVEEINLHGYNTGFNATGSIKGTIHHEIGHSYSSRFDNSYGADEGLGWKDFKSSGPAFESRRLLKEPGNYLSRYSATNDQELHAEMWARMMQVPPDLWSMTDIKYCAFVRKAMAEGGMDTSFLDRRLRCFVNMPEDVRQIDPSFDWR